MGETDCGRELWVNSDDPTDTGTDVDYDYVNVGEYEAFSEAYCNDVDPISELLDARTDKAATDEAGADKSELDADPLESSWAANGVQRTTLYADGKDANGNPLPKTNGLGEDLEARRERLWALNSGFYFNDRSDVGRVDMESRETREVVESIASQCGLTERERENAVQVALGMDGRKTNAYGGRPAMALVGIVRTVADDEETALQRRAVRSDVFEHVAADVCEVSVSRIVEKTFEWAK